MKIKNKIKKNIWVISIIVLGIVILILLISNFYRGANVISEKEVEQLIIDLANLQEKEIEILSIKEERGLYNITYRYGEIKHSVYMTLDGKNFIASVIPFSTLIQRIKHEKEFGCGSSTNNTNTINWTIFKNELPSEIKSKILSFTKIEPKEYEDKIMEFDYNEISNTLIVFYNPSCGWCIRYYPVLVETQQKYPELEIYALDLNNNRDIADKYGVQGTPMNIINGKYFVGGYMIIEDLSEILNKLN